MVIFVQAIVTQVLHVYHQHAEVQLHCGSESEQHIHDHDYAAHHCSLCDFVLHEFERSDMHPFQTTEDAYLVNYQEVASMVSKWHQELQCLEQQLRGPPQQVFLG